MNEISPQTLIVELLTEELPPKNLLQLSKIFSQGIVDGLNIDNLITEPAIVKSFTTPRRLAVMIKNVLPIARTKTIHRKIMPTALALNNDGTPTEAFKKKMLQLGNPLLSVNSFEKAIDGKIEYLFHQETTEPKTLQISLQETLEKTVEKLCNYKKMKYQLANKESVFFVRPAHNLMVLHGKKIVDVHILGLQASRKTLGHRFLCNREIILSDAECYENQLTKEGKVIACDKKRRSEIVRQLKKLSQNANLVTSDNLLDEVTALVEWPKVYACSFDKDFLSVPKECLVLTMQIQQRYFGLSDHNNQLLPSFLVVSNIETETPEQIIKGNERVIRPRFEDAKFFFDQDRQIPLYKRIENLKNITYHQKLGSQADRAERLKIISTIIWDALKVKLENCKLEYIERAALLVKTDLTTNMVTEFPELQGIMGSYYAKEDNEPDEIAAACAEHYLPRYAGDVIPKSNIGKILAIADKIEILISMTIAEGLPKNDKDPMALRRQAVGLIRILIEGSIDIDLMSILKIAFTKLCKKNLLPNTNDPCESIFLYCIERTKNYLYEKNSTWSEINAILPTSRLSVTSEKSLRLSQIPLKINAIRKFSQLPEAQALASANKRIRNILNKNGNLNTDKILKPFDETIAIEKSEIKLSKKIIQLSEDIKNDLANEDFMCAIVRLTQLQEPIDIFFDKVMVNDQNELIKNNRLNLLNKAYRLMNTVADISALGN